jgi:hypothetical protein
MTKLFSIEQNQLYNNYFDAILGESQNIGWSTSCGGLLKDSIGNFGNNKQQLPKSWGTYIHQWKQTWEPHGCLIMVHVV